ncbi:MAG: histidine kinase [Saprospiraceae bacterium]
MIIHLGVLVIAFGNVQLLGQMPPHRHFTRENGLPTNYIYGVVEDSMGVVWAYSERGIARFDGQQFRKVDLGTEFTYADIVELRVDGFGDLVGRTYDGRAFLIQEDGIQDRSEDQSIAKLCWSEDSIYAVSASFQINCRAADQDHRKIPNRSIAYSQSLPLNVWPHAMEQFSLDQQEAFYRQASQDKETRSAGKYAIACLFTNDHIGYLFLLHTRGYLLYIIQENNMNMIADVQVSDPPWKIADEGLLFLPPVIQGDLIRIWAPGYFRIIDLHGVTVDEVNAWEFIPNRTLNRAFRDSQGNLWIATRDDGLFQIPAGWSQTRIWKDPEVPRAVFEEVEEGPEGDLILATDEGSVFRWNGQNLERQKWTSNGRMSVRCLHRDRRHPDKWFLATRREFYELTMPDLTPRPRKVYNTLEDYRQQGGKILDHHWLQSPVIDILTRSDTEDLLVRFGWNGLPKAGILPAGEDRISNTLSDTYCMTAGDGTWWVLGRDSLWHWSLGSWLGEPCKHDGQPRTMILTSDNCLLIGTEGNGLYVYARADRKWTKVLDCGRVYTIRHHENGYLVASSAGVYRIGGSKDNFTVLQQWSQDKGIRSDEVYDLDVWSDQLVIASAEGFVTTPYHPTSTILDQDIPFQIDSILADGQLVSLPLKDLPYTTGLIEVHFSRLDLRSGPDQSFSRMLAPIQDEWLPLPASPLQLSGLAPGQYELNLQATDLDGVKHDLGEKITIRIQPPWWDRSVFKIGMLLVLLSGLVTLLSWRRRVNRQRYAAQQRQMQQLAQLELNALRAQLNPHFVFNALGAVQYYIQTHDVDAADSFLTRFALLMRKYLQASRHQLITLAEELEILKLYLSLECQRFDHQFTFQVEMDADMDADDILVPSQIIQLFLENAINHGLSSRKDGHASLSLLISPAEVGFQVEILDNGIGRDHAARYQRPDHISQGTQIIREKIETLRQSGLMDVTFVITDAYPNEESFPGTRVLLTFQSLDPDEL